MTDRRRPRAARPLDEKSLDDLALRYVSRYATTRSKVRQYLHRKLRERGWDGAGEPPVDTLVERLARLNYVDDRAFALAKAAAHEARGLGRNRLRVALRLAGVGEEEGADAVDAADAAKWESALRFARRRRLGPFAQAAPADARDREKALGAFVRAGHSFTVAAAILALRPDPGADVETLCYQLSHTDE